MKRRNMKRVIRLRNRIYPLALHLLVGSMWRTIKRAFGAWKEI